MEMNHLTPEQILEKVSQSSIAKASAGWKKLFFLAILAGAFISFGAQASSVASFNLISNPDTFGLGRLISSCVFPVGLMMVILCGAELFTGNCLMLIGVLDRKITISQMLRNWVIVYIGNFVGSLFFAFLFFYSGLWNGAGGMIGAVTVNTAVTKVSYDFGPAFVLGFLCNTLVCLAVWMCTGSSSTPGKIMSIFFCIGAFVLSGFEHSIANMYFIPAGLLAATNDAFAQLLQIDTSSLTVSSFLLENLLPVTLGNIAGGCFFVGAAYWLIYRKF